MGWDPALVRWRPTLGLRIVTPRIELRVPSDLEALALAEAAEGLGDGRSNFAGWDTLTGDELTLSMLRSALVARDLGGPDQWKLWLAAFADGDVVGHYALTAEHFGVLRQVETSIWVSPAHQRNGYAREMLSAAMHLAFQGLGAELAHYSAWADNEPSIRTAMSCGYEPNGRWRAVDDGVARSTVHLMLDRTAWRWQSRTDVKIQGLTPECLTALGADQAKEPT